MQRIVPIAMAQSPCAGVDCGAGGNPLPAFIAVGAAVLLEVASGLAVASVVASGAFMLINLGDESRFSRGKKGVIYGCIAFALTLSSQAIISFVVARAVQVDGSQPVLSIMAIGVRSMLIVMNVCFALMMLLSSMQPRKDLVGPLLVQLPLIYRMLLFVPLLFLASNA